MPRGARLERVAAGRGVVVTTGQQPGLFGGPIYTWSKALSALTLADEIEAATGHSRRARLLGRQRRRGFRRGLLDGGGQFPGGAERLTDRRGAPLGRTMADMPLGDVGAGVRRVRSAHAGRRSMRDRSKSSAPRIAQERPWAGPTCRSCASCSSRSASRCSTRRTPASRRPRARCSLRALDRANVVADALRERDEAIRGGGFHSASRRSSRAVAGVRTSLATAVTNADAPWPRREPLRRREIHRDVACCRLTCCSARSSNGRSCRRWRTSPVRVSSPTSPR